MSKRANSNGTRAPAKRAFKWSIQSTEISFMQIGAAEAVIECNPAGCDCGCGSSEVRSRQRRLRRLDRPGVR